MGEAWTSVSPAAASPTLAVSNAADVSYTCKQRVCGLGRRLIEEENGLTLSTRTRGHVPRNRQLTRRRDRGRAS